MINLCKSCLGIIQWIARAPSDDNLFDFAYPTLEESCQFCELLGAWFPIEETDEETSEDGTSEGELNDQEAAPELRVIKGKSALRIDSGLCSYVGFVCRRTYTSRDFAVWADEGKTTQSLLQYLLHYD